MEQGRRKGIRLLECMIMQTILALALGEGWVNTQDKRADSQNTSGIVPILSSHIQSHGSWREWSYSFIKPTDEDSLIALAKI
jgi:hypothetical protein